MVGMYFRARSRGKSKSERWTNAAVFWDGGHFLDLGNKKKRKRRREGRTENVHIRTVNSSSFTPKAQRLRARLLLLKSPFLGPIKDLRLRF